MAKPTQQTSSTVKKPFDKKVWRNHKYDKKFKKQQYDEKRSKAIMRHHFKQVKKGVFGTNTNQSDSKISWRENRINPKPVDVKEDNINSDNKEENNEDDAPELKKGFPSVKRLNAYQQAEYEFQRKKEEKIVQKAEAVKRRSEIKEAISKYNETKKNKMEIIRKKTKKGQPVMKERIEMLYEKIKKQYDNT